MNIPTSIPNESLLRRLPGREDTWFYSIQAAATLSGIALERLPICLRILCENVLRGGDAATRVAALASFGKWLSSSGEGGSVAFRPQRVLMQDAAGLPVLAELASLADWVRDHGGDPSDVAPRLPMDLVVDHAVEVDAWGSDGARVVNLKRDYDRNGPRYRFLKWAAQGLPGLRIAPPGVGICHQLNLEVLATVVTVSPDPTGNSVAGFDSVVGTDSHTTMVNGLSVFGWGVGGIEATAALLGQALDMRIPDVVGVRLVGRLRPGVHATDLTLTLTARLREIDLVQRFVEFFGPALADLSVPDRATLANMAPEYGATMGFFAPDKQTLDYLEQTGRPNEEVALAACYLDAQGVLASPHQEEPHYTTVLEFDLGDIVPTVAGPSRPQQRRTLSEVPASLPGRATERVRSASPLASDELPFGAVAIAAITSCTNTSNPRALVTAGLLARNAVKRGMSPHWWTKASLAPGSQVASQLLVKAGLQADLDALGFHLVGHGCTTCVGNSGPLPPVVESALEKAHNAAANRSLTAVLSGNRNFEGRIHPAILAAYLASPALVVAYGLAGTVDVDLSSEPLGAGADGRPVYLCDLWPDDAQVDAAMRASDLLPEFRTNRKVWRDGSPEWQAMVAPAGNSFLWEDPAGFIRRPPFLDASVRQSLLKQDIVGAKPLLLLGDSVSTDHISPVSRIGKDSPAGRWLAERGVPPHEFGTYSARRLNHDVMLRGGFANPRLSNLLVPRQAGPVTRHLPSGQVMSVAEAAQTYQKAGVPVLVVAGRQYGVGSARDWAAKVTRLLGVRAVIARSFERIHRANLVAFGVLPLELPVNTSDFTGEETFDILGLPNELRVNGRVILHVHGATDFKLELRCLIETETEVSWLRAGGMLAQAVDELGTTA